MEREFTITFFTDNKEEGLKTSKVRAIDRHAAVVLLLVRTAGTPLIIVGVHGKGN